MAGAEVPPRPGQLGGLNIDVARGPLNPLHLPRRLVVDLRVNRPRAARRDRQGADVAQDIGRHKYVRVGLQFEPLGGDVDGLVQREAGPAFENDGLRRDRTGNAQGGTGGVKVVELTRSVLDQVRGLEEGVRLQILARIQRNPAGVVDGGARRWFHHRQVALHAPQPRGAAGASGDDFPHFQVVLGSDRHGA